jgi:hypothetical protein
MDLVSSSSEKLPVTELEIMPDKVPPVLVIVDQRRRRELLRITDIGQVLAPDLEAASEAGRIFIQSIRNNLACLMPKKENHEQQTNKT